MYPEKVPAEVESEPFEISNRPVLSYGSCTCPMEFRFEEMREELTLRVTIQQTLARASTATVVPIVDAERTPIGTYRTRFVLSAG